MGKLLTCVPRLTLAQLRTTIRSTTGGACRRDLKTSHRPDGRLTLCSLFAGRRYSCRWRHSGHLIVHHQWEHSCICARSKVPIAPMGDSHFARCLQGGGVFVDGGGSVTFDSCNITGNTAQVVRACAQNFPSPRWDFHMFCFVLGLQGGGVHIGSGRVSFSSCTITGNTVYYVRAHAQKFPSPRWEDG